jgi:tight adherence protein B
MVPEISDILIISVMITVMVWSITSLVLDYTRALRKKKFDRRIISLLAAYDYKGDVNVKKQIKSDRSIEEALKELEDLKKQNKTYSLRSKIRQAGISMTFNQFILRSTLLLLVSLVGLLLSSLSLVFVLATWILLAYFLTYGYLNYLINRRMKKISKEFPTALDVIHRALRSGLPLLDAIRLSADETVEPLKSELRQVLGDMSVGMTMEESMQRLAKRVPMQDAKFVATVINIQSSTGGNLSGAIGNLLETVRQREQLHNKIQSASAEALTSAKIIGGMPVLVTIGMFFLLPEQLDVFFETRDGQAIFIGCLAWMALGAIVLRQMTRIRL